MERKIIRPEEIGLITRLKQYLEWIESEERSVKSELKKRLDSDWRDPKIPQAEKFAFESSYHRVIDSLRDVKAELYERFPEINEDYKK